jgi:ligand-binding SRPBCC domain-containing protein
MPRIFLKTRVKGTPSEIMKRFDKSLFEKLSPPGAGVELLRFDGSEEGDEVHLRMSLLFGLIKQDWFARISEDGENEEEAWFIDEGIKLPFFLMYWRHRHLARTDGPEHSYIIDDIDYLSPTCWLGRLIYPIMYLQFAWRKPIYRKVFGQ